MTNRAPCVKCVGVCFSLGICSYVVCVRAWVDSDIDSSPSSTDVIHELGGTGCISLTPSLSSCFLCLSFTDSLCVSIFLSLPFPPPPIPQYTTLEVLPLHCISPSLSPPPLQSLTHDWLRGGGGRKTHLRLPGLAAHMHSLNNNYMPDFRYKASNDICHHHSCPQGLSPPPTPHYTC